MEDRIMKDHDNFEHETIEPHHENSMGLWIICLFVFGGTLIAHLFLHDVNYISLCIGFCVGLCYMAFMADITDNKIPESWCKGSTRPD